MTFELKKILEENNFTVSEIIDNILVVENFISKEELEDVFSIINKLTEEDWRAEYLLGVKKFCLDKFGRDDIDNLISEGKFEITKNWNDKVFNISISKISRLIYSRLGKVINVSNNLELDGFQSIQRMQPGVELVAHTDKYTDPSIEYATILYLNDDYTNGELFFKNKNFTIKPNSRSLLIFPGTDEFEHGVSLVGDGPTRYVLVGFIKVKNFYKNKKN
jgi:hypothetical protein